MASESTEEGSVTVSLGPELEEWLDARAATLGVDRETVLLQLVATSRAADLDGVADAGDLASALAEAKPVREAVATAADDIADDRIAAAIEAAVDEEVEEAVGEEVEEAVDGAVEGALEDAVEGGVEEAVESALADRLQTIEADFQAKIEDVRERVIQVKQEADARAPADHDHEAFDRIDAIGGRLADLEESIADLEQSVETVEADLDTLADRAADGEDARGEISDTVDELQDRLKTVAWVVSDLREAHESRDGSAALEELKRSAASADASRATCEHCGEGVKIGLLTEPRCPHCDATVTSVAPAEGFFGNPQLLVASQLESGDGR